MYKYELAISTNIKHIFIQHSPGKLFQCTKTHIDHFMIRYRKNNWIVTLTGKWSFICRSSLGQISPVWCSSIQGMYAGLTGGSICHGYLWIVLYVLELPSLVQQYSRHLCSIDWVVHLTQVYMFILLYVKLIWCNGLACSSGCLGVHLLSVYMFIVLCVKCMWCNGFAEIYARSAMRCDKCGVAVLKASVLDRGCIVLYMKLIWYNGFAEIYAQLDWREVNLPQVYVLCSIYIQICHEMCQVW